jgi:hypothetical protein
LRCFSSCCCCCCCCCCCYCCSCCCCCCCDVQLYCIAQDCKLVLRRICTAELFWNIVFDRVYSPSTCRCSCQLDTSCLQMTARVIENVFIVSTLEVLFIITQLNPQLPRFLGVLIYLKK